MLKKSFTFFEVLVSLVVLAITFSIILKLFSSDDTIEVYYELQKMENQYYQTGSVTNSEKIIIK